VRWRLSHRFDPPAVAIADRHYSRQRIGSPQFVAPGRCVVLLAGTADAPALWVSSWPFAEYTHHAWPGAWICSLFRNEGAGLSSELILEAIAATRSLWGTPPPRGMVTFVNRDKVRPKRDPGRCYLRAGFRPVGETGSGLLALQLEPGAIPEPVPAIGSSPRLFDLVGRCER
jgi:hypothetical protein